MTTESLLASRRAPLWAALLIGLAIAAAYANSFRGAFVFDDVTSIEENPTIRGLGSSLRPPPGALTVSGRPVLNLSLALNYAVSGTRVGSYHAVNLMVHLLAALALYGIARRTLARRADPAGGDGTANGAALALALLWGLHPLQTESVTYVVQRAESLMGLCYLLTLYSFIRYADSLERGAASARGWAALAVSSCLLGMATKEVMVSAPLLVLLYDRTLVSGSWGGAWRRHRRLYGGLAATWLLLGVLVAGNGDHAGTAGFGPGTADYWRTQVPAVVRYLGLSFWPHPLVLDYGMQSGPGPAALAAGGLAVGLLAAATVLAIWRNSPLGFLGAWFFAILAPTSLVPGTQQTMAEHRMYLPLAAVLALGLAAVLARIRSAPRWRGAALGLGLALAAAGGIATAERNADYRSDLAIWADTVAKNPGLPLGHHNLGRAYAERGRFAAAVVQDEEALRLNPASAYGEVNLGSNLEQLGRMPEAILHFRAAVRLQPGWAGLRDTLAGALSRAGLLPEAVDQYREALRIKPDYSQAENGLGLALFRLGRTAEAIGQFQEALRLDPASSQAENSLGTAFAAQGRLPEAMACWRHAVQLDPDFLEAHLSLGNAYYQAGQLDAAIGEYAAAVRLPSAPAEVHDRYGILLARAGRLPAAAEQFRTALGLRPDDGEARADLQQIERRSAPPAP